MKTKLAKTGGGEWVLWEGVPLARAEVMALLASMEASDAPYALTGDTILVHCGRQVVRAKIIATMHTKATQKTDNAAREDE